MALVPEETSDGIKLRNTKTGKLAGAQSTAGAAGIEKAPTAPSTAPGGASEEGAALALYKAQERVLERRVAGAEAALNAEYGDDVYEVDLEEAMADAANLVVQYPGGSAVLREERAALAVSLYGNDIPVSEDELEAEIDHRLAIKREFAEARAELLEHRAYRKPNSDNYDRPRRFGNGTQASARDYDRRLGAMHRAELDFHGGAGADDPARVALLRAVDLPPEGLAKVREQYLRVRTAQLTAQVLLERETDTYGQLSPLGEWAQRSEAMLRDAALGIRRSCLGARMADRSLCTCRRDAAQAAG